MQATQMPGDRRQPMRPNYSRMYRRKTDVQPRVEPKLPRPLTWRESITLWIRRHVMTARDREIENRIHGNLSMLIRGLRVDHEQANGIHNADIRRLDARMSEFLLRLEVVERRQRRKRRKAKARRRPRK